MQRLGPRPVTAEFAQLALTQLQLVLPTHIVPAGQRTWTFIDQLDLHFSSHSVAQSQAT